MNPTQTTQDPRNSSKGSSPFTQIQELEKREKERVEKELVAMQNEKEEVVQAVAKKEASSTEEYKNNAKSELKEYSEKELTIILSKATADAESEVERTELAAKKGESTAVQELVSIAKNL